MQNLLVEATLEELLDFSPPDFIVFNAGCFPANKYTTGKQALKALLLLAADFRPLHESGFMLSLVMSLVP